MYIFLCYSFGSCRFLAEENLHISGEWTRRDSIWKNVLGDIFSWQIIPLKKQQRFLYRKTETHQNKIHMIVFDFFKKFYEIRDLFNNWIFIGLLEKFAAIRVYLRNELSSVFLERYDEIRNFSGRLSSILQGKPKTEGHFSFLHRGN